MVFKDCKAERDCKFLVKISSKLYKIVKSGGPLIQATHTVASYLSFVLISYRLHKTVCY